MFDPNQVLQQARAHMSPPNWQVLPAKQSHFLQALFGGIVLIILGIGAAGYLLLNPGFIVGLASLVNVDNLFTFWRVADFVICAFIVLGGAGLIRGAVAGMATQEQQMLVLMPEGFVMQKGASSKTMAAIAYANVNTPKLVVQNGAASLLMARANGQGALRVRLDGRFGPPKQIAKRIIEAHQLFVHAQVRG